MQQIATTWNFTPPDENRFAELLNIFGCADAVAPLNVDAFGRKAGELIWRAVSIPKPTLLQTEVGSTERQPIYQRTSLLDMINHLPRSDRLTLLATAAASTSILIVGAAFLDF
jgi:hypothetical protein